MSAALPGRLVLLGHPVAQSLSPTFQNAALRAAGIPLTYAPVDVAPAALAESLESLVSQRAAGNVTAPHKEAVYMRCDRVTPIAAQVGAVNTFWTVDGELVGDNTDIGGCERAIEVVLGALDAGFWNAAVLGAGGAAAAAVRALAVWGAERVRVWNRSPRRAHDLATRLESVSATIEVATTAAECVAGAAMVINATSLGMRDDDPLPVDPTMLAPDAAVLDLVYRRGETRWVHEARARGHRASDGIVMLVEQGALAFERWFGFAPDRRAMWDAIGGRPAMLPASHLT